MLHNRPSSPVVAILALDGYLDLYSDTLRFVSWKLRRDGYSPLLIGCTGALSTCTSFNSIANAYISYQDPSAVCRRCTTAQKKIFADQRYLLHLTDLAGFAAAQQYLNDVKSVLRSSPRPEHTFELEYLGFPLCRYAFFDFSITWKVSETSILDADLEKSFLSGVEDQLRLLRFLESLPELRQITQLIYLNGNYSLNTLAREYFKQFGVDSISVELQLTSQRLFNHIKLIPCRLALQPDSLTPTSVNGLPPVSPSRSDVRCLLTAFRARIQGSAFNAYTNLEIQASLGPERTRLTKFFGSYSRLHSVFLSSEDEMTPHIHTHGLGSSLKSFFPSQFAFIEYLLEHASRSPDIGFVLRLHPRMAKNKRERIESIEHDRYKKLFASKSLPKNVYILYGDSTISSYYLAWKSHLVIITWSTIGLEALLLGCPVVSVFPDRLMYPIARFSCQPGTHEEIDDALFRVSFFGVPLDSELLFWMASSYESQFVSTVAPRGGVNTWARLYKLIYKVLDKLLLYEALCRSLELFGTGRFNRTIFSLFSNSRLIFCIPPRVASPEFMSARLTAYRDEHSQMFSNYDVLFRQD